MPLLPIVAAAAVATDPGAWLAATRWIDVRHPAVVAATEEAVGTRATARERAVAIHDWVRERVPFGFSRSFYRQRASDVLRAGVGYCNTKATLFIAMLRAAGIPARQRFVTLRSDVLHGFVDFPGSHLHHSYTEVFLDGRWIGTDSYVVDATLFARAHARVQREGRVLGWAVHAGGGITWDGSGPAFVQFVDDGRVPDLTTRDDGVFADTMAFYDTGERLDALRGVQRFVIPLVLPGADRRVRAFRDDE